MSSIFVFNLYFSTKLSFYHFIAPTTRLCLSYWAFVFSYQLNIGQTHYVVELGSNLIR